MTWIAIAVVLFFVIAVLAIIAGKQRGAGSTSFPYQPAKALFSPAERSFLGVIDQVVGAEYRVFGKVRVADVAAVTPRQSRSSHQGALNRIAAKHFDFVVCRASDLSIVCAIELNDKSHASSRAQARDEFFAKVCQTIRLPLLTFPAKAAYSPTELRAQFVAAIPALAASAADDASQAPREGARERSVQPRSAGGAARKASPDRPPEQAT